MKKDIAVLVHLYYIDLWKEYLTYIKGINYTHDIYINLVKGSYDDKILLSVKEKLEKNSENIKVIISENYGLDIGGTMCLINEMFNSNIEYKYILKLHTKKSIHSGRTSDNSRENGKKWRNLLTKPIVGTPFIIDSVVNLFKGNKSVGMIGSKFNILDNTNKFALLNNDLVNEYMERFNMEVDIDNIRFVAGTMFWVDYKIIKHYFSIIKPLDIFNEIKESNEYGAFSDMNKSTKSHAFERIFGLMVLDQNKKIMGI